MLESLLLFTLLAAPPADSWPGFRGDGTSTAASESLPLKWSDDENLAWSIDLPGFGQSSPVVWKRRIFVSSVNGPNKETLLVTSVDVSTGKLLWKQEFPASQTVEVSDYVSQAAPTPVADEAGVYAFFESGDLISLDNEGQERWKRSLAKEYGHVQGNHGLGGSPIQTKETVILLVDHVGPSYLLAVDKKTGKNVWKTDRKARVSWSSPLLVKDDTGESVLVSSNGEVEAFDAKSGERIWWLEGIEGNNVPSPAINEKLVVIGSSTAGNNLAFQPDGKGSVKPAQVAWRAKGITSSFGSPLVFKGHAYFVNRSGVASCVNLETGEPAWTERLSASCWTTPIGSGDRIYFFAKDGVTTVVRTGPKFEKLAENTLSLTPPVYGVAAIKSAFIVRTRSKLTCIGRPPTRKR